MTALSSLTDREREVAGLIALGYTNAEVGRLLEIHQKTVESHRHHLMTKLGLRTRAALVRFALVHDLVNSGPVDRFFQSCAGCSVFWSMRGEFLSDREVIFQGYQSAEAASSPGGFRFQHLPCGAQLLVALETFIELAGEPPLAASCARRSAAAEYCLAWATRQPCPPRCVCAFVRRTSQILHYWPKN